MTQLFKLFVIWISIISCFSLMSINISLISNQHIEKIEIDGKEVFNETSNKTSASESPMNKTFTFESVAYGQSITFSRISKYFEEFWIEAIIHFGEETWNSSSYWMWTINQKKITKEDYSKFSSHFNSNLVLLINTTKDNQNNTFTFTIPYLCSCQNDTVISSFPEPALINMSNLISPNSLEGLISLLNFQIISISSENPLGPLTLANKTEVTHLINYSIQNITYQPKKPGEKVIITYVGSTNTNSTNQCTITIAICGVNCATCNYHQGMISCETCVEGFRMNENRICSLRCSTGCKKCSILGECDNCLDNYYLKEDAPYSCYQGLISGYYFEDRLLKYLSCSKNCLICSNRFDCHICNDGYYFYNGNCIQNFTSIEDAFKNIKENLKYYAEEVRYIEQVKFHF